jgi:hypothetical protein
MIHMEEYNKDFFTFLECGFIAISQLDETSARDLFAAARMIQPHNTLLTIADGYMHFVKMQLEAAVKSFEEVLKKEPNNEMAKTFLGLALSMTPKTMAKGEEILRDRSKHTHDAQVKKLADDTVTFVETYLKKPSVMHPKGK